METVLICFIFLSLTFTGVLFTAAFGSIALFQLFLIRRKPRQGSSLNKSRVVAAGEESLPAETISPEAINIPDTEDPVGQELAVIRVEQKWSPVVSEWNETDSKFLFYGFIVAWLKVRGFQIRSRLFGDEVLIFQQDDGADSQAVSIGAVGVWRPGFIKGRLEWARSFQMIRYRQFEKTENLPFFSFIGIGGSPEMPESIYIVPLRQIRSNVLSEVQLKTCLFRVDGNVVFENGFELQDNVDVG
jgi:hypothetical protein